MPQNFSGPLTLRPELSNTQEWFSNQEVGNNPDFLAYFNDFNTTNDYLSSDWTLTQTNSGTAAITAGILTLTTGATSTNNTYLQNKLESFKFVPGKRTWFEARCKATRVVDADILIGLGVTDTTPLVTTEQAAFRITNGSAAIACVSTLGGVVTSSAAQVSAVASAYNLFGMYYDGTNLNFYIDRNRVAQILAANVTANTLCLTLGVVTGSANAATLIADYLYVQQER